MWTIWFATHRGIFFGIVTLVTWVAAIYWFFKVDLKRMKHNNRPHNWAVNMETKTGTGGTVKSKH